jgi:hypothetical protein
MLKALQFIWNLMKGAPKRVPTPKAPAPKAPAKPNAAKDKADNVGDAAKKRGLACKGCTKPNRRHDPCKTKSGDFTKDKNSMVDPDHAGAVGKEIDDIIAGGLEKQGEFWTAASGRRYSSHDNTLFPVDGPGIKSVDRMQHQLIKELNTKGLDGTQKMIDALKAKGILSEEKIKDAVNLWKKCGK